MTFQTVKTSAKKHGWCPACNKKVSRSRTFEKTIDPFNKNKDGSVKTYAQVLMDVKAEALKWVPDFTHENCKTVPRREES